MAGDERADGASDPPARRFQLCLAHQLCDLQFARECNDQTFDPAMQELLHATLAVVAARPQIDLAVYERLHQVIETACDRRAPGYDKTSSPHRTVPSSGSRIQHPPEPVPGTQSHL